MQQTHKVYIKEDMTLSSLVLENPSLLLMMDFFGIDYAIHDDKVKDICTKKGIHLSSFLLLANLYNGFLPNNRTFYQFEVDIPTIIHFLKQTHLFYKKDKYPQIQRCIKKLYNEQNKATVERIEYFFDDYFKEVLEHLKYEDEIAFPYFSKLISNKQEDSNTSFSVNEYRTHHGDIETKLSDLKNLLIKHIDLDIDFSLKRRIITRLFELENDLKVHSLIEDIILLPAVDKLEKTKSFGK